MDMDTEGLVVGLNAKREEQCEGRQGEEGVLRM